MRTLQRVTGVEVEAYGLAVAGTALGVCIVAKWIFNKLDRALLVEEVERHLKAVGI